MKHIKHFVKEEYGNGKGDVYRKSFEIKTGTPYDKAINQIPKTLP